MNFNADPELEAFRLDVRDFVRANLPEDIRRNASAGFNAPRDHMLRWAKILHTRGWSAPHWHKDWGGPGWTANQRFVFEEECYMAGAPMTNIQAYTHVGPVISTFGSDWQKKRFLGPILRGEEYWCQGFSEPGAGSDLANLRTKAVIDGDDYVVNGSKIWTSNAHEADWIFLIVRTKFEGKPQAGITFLLADMKSPGITVKPIISIDGGHHLNEVFFDDVRVPVRQRVGEENKGWDYSKYLLVNERVFASAEIPQLKRYLRKLRTISRQEQSGGGRLIDDAAYAQRLAKLDLEVQAVETSVIRAIQVDQAASPMGLAVGAILKTRGTDLQQQLEELLVDSIGEYGAVFYGDGHAPHGSNQPAIGPDYAAGNTAQFFFRRSSTIAGGSNEVQRNIIAKMMLQL
jgi:acyl-CoA dehydrogenase